MAGNIGAGKTTAAKMISQEFGYELFDEPVIDNRFLASYYGDMPRWSFTLQLEFLIRRAEHHDIIEKVPKNCIQDRTLLEDPEVFAKYLHGLGHMTDSELALYFEYFHRINKDLIKPDKIIFLQVKDETTLQNRIQGRGRVEEKNLPISFLEGLSGYYKSLPSICQAKYGIETLTVDVSKIDIRSTGKEEFLSIVSDFLNK
jgi:deoxyadenosine/deoxycytidine kinase